MDPTDGIIELTIPADARMVRLVRLVASGLASTAGFDVDQLDDLRIAVDEGVSALLEGGDGSRLPLRFAVDGGRITMDGRVRSTGEGLDADRLELSTQILESVCDDHELGVVDGEVVVRISRRIDDN